MTEKQKRFCDEYLIEPNATKAAIKAGYSHNSAGSIGNENLQKPEIIEYIKEKTDKMSEEKIANAEEVMEYLTSVMRGKSKSEIVVVESLGDFTSEARRVTKLPDEKERLKAAELLGKRMLMFDGAKEKLELEKRKVDNTEVDKNIVIKFDGDIEEYSG